MPQPDYQTDGATGALPDIPFLDVRSGSLHDVLQRFPERAKMLAARSMELFGPAAFLARGVGAPLADRISRRWLTRRNNPYLGEIDAFARTLRINGVHLLNVCFEWGCTSGVFSTAQGPVLRRVLDWRFPALGESLVVVHQSGEAGDFHNVTWPGLSGAFQAFAPGRFSVALNQAPSRSHGAGFIGDWIVNRAAANRAEGLPAAHLLRRVCEVARDYESACEILCREPIAVPAIFILAGTDENEGCVIERTEHQFQLREIVDGCVCAANHFEAQFDGNWIPRPIDSAGRALAATKLPAGGMNSPFAWFTPPIANANSRLAMNANAATGTMSLIGTAGPRPVTRMFEWSSAQGT